MGMIMFLNTVWGGREVLDGPPQSGHGGLSKEPLRQVTANNTL